MAGRRNGVGGKETCAQPRGLFASPWALIKGWTAEISGLLNARRLTLGLTIALAVGSLAVASVCLLVGVNSGGPGRARTAEHLVERTYQAIDATRRITNVVQRAELGEREYLVTQDSAYLETYRRDRRVTLERLAELPLLADDSGAQQDRVRALAALVLRKFEELDRTIHLVQGGDRSGVLDYQAAQPQSVDRDQGTDIAPPPGLVGFQLTRQIAVSAQQVVETEEQLLSLRQDAAAEAQRRMSRVFYWLSVSGFVCFIVAVVSLLASLVGQARVSRRLAVARAREESAAAMQALFAASPVGIVRSDIEGHVLEANDIYLEMIGQTRAALEAGQIRWDEVTPPEWMPASRAGVAEAMANGRCAAYEKELLRTDGTRVPVLAAFAVIDQPEPLISGFLVDLSELRRIESALHQSDVVAKYNAMMLRGITDHTADGILMADARSQVRFANPAAARMLGCAAEDVVGRGLDEALRLAEFGEAGSLLGDRQDDALLQEQEILLCRPDGSTVEVACSSAPIPQAGGGEGVVLVMRDVSGRRQAEAAVRDSEARFRTLFENVPVGLVLIDPDSGEIAAFNDTAARIVGLTRDELGARGIGGVFDIPPESMRRSLQMVMAEDNPQTFEWRQARPDSTFVTVRVVARQLSMDGVTMVFSAWEDISDLKRAEAALRNLTAHLDARVREEVAARTAAQTRAVHAEKMQTLGQLAGGIAHDFNNVLQVVTGAVSLIATRAQDPLAVMRFARLATEAATRGSSITRRLLAFAHRDELRAEPISLRPLLDGLRQVFEHTLGAAISVRMVERGEVPAVLADRGQLETVLVNLATNARDAMPAGGTLTIETVEEIVSGSAAHRGDLMAGRYVRIAVSDSGIGMDEVVLARVTEPFFTTKGSGRGTGLGLSMAKGFAEQSGGALALDSTPGLGTTVTLWLPLADINVARDALPDAMRRQAEQDAWRVLLVDDDELVRVTLAAQLEAACMRVTVAVDGTEALALLDLGTAVDFLVTDLSMPGMSGADLIREAQVRRPGLPAVLLTGYAGDGAALAVQGAISGAFSLLRKPIQGAHLADRIAAILEARTLSHGRPAGRGQPEMEPAPTLDERAGVSGGG